MVLSKQSMGGTSCDADGVDLFVSGGCLSSRRQFGTGSTSHSHSSQQGQDSSPLLQMSPELSEKSFPYCRWNASSFTHHFHPPTVHDSTEPGSVFSKSSLQALTGCSDVPSAFPGCSVRLLVHQHHLLPPPDGRAEFPICGLSLHCPSHGPAMPALHSTGVFGVGKSSPAQVPMAALSAPHFSAILLFRPSAAPAVSHTGVCRKPCSTTKNMEMASGKSSALNMQSVLQMADVRG